LKFILCNVFLYWNLFRTWHASYYVLVSNKSLVLDYNRKIQDVKNIGLTYLLMKSFKAKPSMVQELCLKAKKEDEKAYCIFIEASSKGGAIPTETATYAISHSKDNITWENLPDGLSPVTGKMDKQAYALIFDKLEIMDDVMDLWNYSDFFNEEEPIKIIQGASTICASKKDMKHHSKKMISRYRRIMAIGRLYAPYCVYLR